MKLKRINPHNIVVKYNHGWYQGRIQTSLSFEEDYIQALRSALNLVRSGMTQVELIQYRETLHSHSELREAVSNLKRYATDEEILEQVHHATNRPRNVNLIRLLSSPLGANVGTIWACAG